MRSWECYNELIIHAKTYILLSILKCKIKQNKNIILKPSHLSSLQKGDYPTKVEYWRDRPISMVARVNHADNYNPVLERAYLLLHVCAMCIANEIL